MARDSDDTLAATDPTESGDVVVSRRAPRESIVRALIAHRYEILAMLGAGGMGTVYRARDRELDEMVALKVLNPELVDSPEALGRFKSEVKLARRVTHRNVARTFDFGHDGELRYLTMEYVDGLSLEERISSDPRLSTEEVVHLTRQILQGLQAAHGAGVLHRDLKPANVMLARDGRVVLMDFGIAHALETVDRDRRTKQGLVGTPLYMSPEQVEGARDLDARSDLYALGLMVHEMLTREVPFDGPSPFAVAAARLTRPPPVFPVHDAPPAFARLVDRMVARSREERPASADAALAELGEAHSLPPPVSSSPPAWFVEPAQHGLRLAVLGLAAEERVRHVASSVAEELAELLASSPRAHVVLGRALTHESSRDAGRRLGVDVLVEGRLEEHAGQFSVRLRLVGVDDGFLITALRTQTPLAQLPRWLEGAAAHLAQALESKLDVAPRAPTDPVTLDLYFRGRSEFHKRWRDAARNARELLSQAYERAPDDPQVVSAYALLLTRMFGFQGDVDEELATRLVERAHQLAPGRADSMMARAALHFQTGHFEACFENLRGVLTRSPQHADALEMVARILSEVGPPDEALRALELARSVDPRLVTLPIESARVHALLGEWDEATRHLELLGPTVPRALYIFSKQRLLHLWRRDKARNAELLELLENDPSFSEGERATISYFLASTQQASAEVLQHLPGLLRTTLAASPKQVRRAAFNAQIRAEVLALHELWNDVLTDLEAAEQHGLFDQLWIDRLPLFDPLRGTPRFERVRHVVSARAARVRELLPRATARAR